MKVTEDHRANTHYHRWVGEQQEAGLAVERSMEVWNPFMAGWNARQAVALGAFKSDGGDIDIVDDYVKNAQSHADRAWEQNIALRRSNYGLQHLIDAWRLAKEEQRQQKYDIRDGKIDPRDVDLPLWKRISMQRKELKALHREIGERDRRIKKLHALLQDLV